MPRLVFHGRIHCAAHSISLTSIPVAGWKDTALGLEISYRLEIKDNSVTVTSDVNKYVHEDHFTSVFMRASDIARSAVEVIAFAKAQGLVMSFDKVVLPNGDESRIDVGDPSLASLSTATIGEGFDQVIRIVMSEPPLFLALRDLIDAISQWHQAPITAARAIERLRHSIAPSENDRKKQWKRLGDLLNLDESYTKPIRDASIGPRHGDPTHIPGPITSEITKRAWIIMNRYLEFRKRGGTLSLPESEFSLLT